MTDEWVANTSIGWRILLTAELASPPDPGQVLDLLTDLFTRHRWPGAAEVRTDDDIELLRSRLTEAAAPVILGVAGSRLVISAHHGYVDGLGLLEVLAEVTGRPAAARVRGVANRPMRDGLVRATGRRLTEAAFRPPAKIASPAAAGGGGDVFAETTVPGSWRTAELVNAAVRGVARHNDASGRRTRHIAVAVGAGRPRSEDEPIADRSALIRLTDLEDRSAEEIAELLRTAPLEPPPAARGRARARALSGGIRLFSRRLGSTILISHLGEVTADGATGLAFHPVTAGGSGVSLGAVALDGATTVALRARAARWDRAGLERLLDEIVVGLA